MKINRNIKNCGFTLVETVIAMGIIAVMVTAFLAAFGPAVQGVRKSISYKEANRLSSSLEAELSVLRPGESQFTTAFEKAFTWIEGSVETAVGNDNMVLIYQYRGDPNNVREDGTLMPIAAGDNDIPGETFVIQSVVRRLGDPQVDEELIPRVVEGRVFYVRMTQLIFNASGELEVSNQPGTIRGQRPPNTVSDHVNYPDAVIAMQVEFFVMESSLVPYIRNTFDPDRPGKAVFTGNLAVRR